MSIGTQFQSGLEQAVVAAHVMAGSLSATAVIRATISQSALELAADVSTGATSLTLRDPAGRPIRGEIPEGAVLTIGGEEHSLSADADAKQESTITAALGSELLSDHSEGAAVTYTNEVTLTLATTVPDRVKTDLVAAGQAATRVQRSAIAFLVPVSGMPLRSNGERYAPKEGWMVTYRGIRGTVNHVERDPSGLWRVEVSP